MKTPITSRLSSGRHWIFVASTLLILAACGTDGLLNAPEVKPNAALQLERQPNGDYVLSSDQGGTQDIFMGTRVSNIDWTKPYGQKEGKRTLILNPGPADRYFVGLLTKSDDTLIVSDKRIPLMGSNNFRDIGGIPTRDGRYVRWGQIYRSDRLSALTKDDLKYLNALGLATVIDFRSESEVAEAPDVFPRGSKIDYQNQPIYFDIEDTTNLRERIMTGEISASEAGDILVQGNRLFATTMAERFQPFIDCLLEDKGPLVYHCTSGKDRTGFATMLLLSALNVGRDTILQDYLLSNFYRYEMNKSRMKKLRYAAIVKRNLDLETIAPLMIVDRRYINAAYDAIEEKYGNVTTFLESEYGLTAEKRAQLIDIYTYGPAISVDGQFVPAEEGDLEKPTEAEVDEVVPAAEAVMDTTVNKTMKLPKAASTKLSEPGSGE